MRKVLVLMFTLCFFAVGAHAQRLYPYDYDNDGSFRVARLPAIDGPTEPRPVVGHVPEVPEPVISGPADEELIAEPVAADEEVWQYGWWEPLTKKWEGSFELGLNGTEGNSETFNVRFGGKLKRETNFSSQVFEIVYNDQSSNGLNTARNLLADLRIEWPWADTPWSLYVHGLGEYDEFKPFDIRLAGDAGLGYMFYETELSKLKGRVGGGVSKEYGSADNDVKPEVAFGIDWERRLSDRQKMSLVVDYFPSFDDFSDARINTNASWEVVVDPDWGLSFKLSVIDRYDSTPSAAKHNDINYAALMLWSF
jgi:hypothetical protein